MGLLDNLSIMLGNTVASSVFDWIRAVSSIVDGVSPSLSQATWFIDPINGNDNNSGLTTTTALRTFKEYRRRVADGPLLSNQVVTIMSSLLSTDILDLDFLDTGGFSLDVIGQTTVALAAQTILAYTPRAAATNVPNQLTNTAVTVWTPFVGNGFFISPTSGPAIGKRASVAFDQGANVARVSTFIDATSAETQPVATNTFDVLSVPTVPFLKAQNININIRVTSLNFITNVVRFNSGPMSALNAQFVQTAQFTWCCFAECPLIKGNVAFVGTQFMAASKGGNISIIGSGSSKMNGCFFTDPAGAAWNLDEYSEPTINTGTIFQGTSMALSAGHPVFTNCSFFDTVLTAINARRGSFVRAQTLYGDTGAGNPFACTLDRTSHIGQIGAGQTLTNGGANEIAMVLTASTTWAAVRAAGGVKDGATSDASSMVIA
jgi:hypothetical protein